MTELIGRESQLDQLYHVVERVATNPRPRTARDWVFIVEGGGVGKTYLMRYLAARLQSDGVTGSRAVLTAFIDMQSPSSLLDESLIFQLVQTLRQQVKAHRTHSERDERDIYRAEGRLRQADGADERITEIEREVDERYFQAFFDSLQHLSQARRDFVGDVDAFKADLFAAFRDLYHALVRANYMMVIIFDTVEELQRMDSAFEQQMVERIVAFIREQIYTLPRTVFILSGRDYESRDRQQPYDWYLPDADFLHHPGEDITDPFHIGGLERRYAEDILALLVLPPAEYEDEDSRQSKLYQRIAPDILDSFFAAFADAVPGRPPLYRPIYLVILAEIYKRTRAIDRTMFTGDKEQTERSLVRAYLTATRKSEIVLRYMSLGPYHFDRAMIREFTGEAGGAIYEDLKRLEFVKRHPDDTLTLFDEARRLIETHVTEPLRVNKVQVLMKILDRYLDRQSEIQDTIARLISHGQNIMPELDTLARWRVNQVVYGRQTESPSAPGLRNLPGAEADGGVDTGLISLQAAIDQQQLELEETVLVHEMTRILGEIGPLIRDHNAPAAMVGRDRAAYLKRCIDVFDRRWRMVSSNRGLLPPRSDDHNGRSPVDTMRAALIERVRDDIEMQPDQRIADWVADHADEPDIFKPRYFYRVRQREIELFLSDQGEHDRAEREYDDLLRYFNALDDTGIDAIRIQLNLHKGSSAIRNIHTNLDAARESFSAAHRIVERGLKAGATDLTRFRSRVALMQGWLNRLDWKVDSAIDYYRVALESFRDEDSSDPSRRWRDFGELLYRYAFAERYINAHSALHMTQIAYYILLQTRRSYEIMRSLLTLSLVNRLCGNYESAFFAAEQARLLALARGDDESERESLALAHIRLASTFYNALEDNFDPAASDHLYDRARENLGTGIEILQSLYERNFLVRGELIQAYFSHTRLELYRLRTLDRDEVESRRAYNEAVRAVIEKASTYFNNGWRLLLRFDNPIFDDPYRYITALQTRIEFKFRQRAMGVLDYADFNYRQHLMDSAEFHEIQRVLASNPDVETSVSVVLGKVEQMAGALAQMDAIGLRDATLFDRAIAHYIRALLQTGSQSGYHVVAFKAPLEFLERQFESMLSAGYAVLLIDWCDQMEAAWKERNEAEVGSARKHPRLRWIMPQLPHLCRIFRARAYHEHLKAFGEATGGPYATVAQVCARQDFDTAHSLVSLLSQRDVRNQIQRGLLLLAFPGLADMLDEQPGEDLLDALYSRYADPDGLPLPTWEGQPIDWVQLTLAVARVRLHHDDNLLLLAARQGWYLAGVRGPLKLEVARYLRFRGHIAVAQSVLEAALDDLLRDHNSHDGAECMLQLCYILAQQGDYLSAWLYARHAQHFMDDLDDDVGLLRARIAGGVVYQTWGRVAGLRGAHGMVDDVFAQAQRQLQQVDAFLDIEERMRAEIEDLLRERSRQAGLTHLYRSDEYVIQYHAPPPDAIAQQTQQLKDALKAYGVVPLDETQEFSALGYLQPWLDDEPDTYRQAELAAAYREIGRIYWNLYLFQDDRTAYRREALAWLQKSYDLAWEIDALPVQAGVLVDLLELRYVTSLHKLEKYLDNVSSDEMTYQRFMNRYITDNSLSDEYHKALADLYERLKTSMELPLLQLVRELTGGDPGELPDGCSHDFARLDMIRGVLAQKAGLDDEAIDAFCSAGHHTAASAESDFHVDMLLRFLTRRLRVMNIRDPRAQQGRVEVVCRSWSESDIMKDKYPDLETFTSILPVLVKLQERS